MFAFSVFHERYKCFEDFFFFFFEKTENNIQPSIDIGVCEVNLRPPTLRILADYFSRAESVPKAIDNTWKFVVLLSFT